MAEFVFVHLDETFQVPARLFVAKTELFLSTIRHLPDLSPPKSEVSQRHAWNTARDTSDFQNRPDCTEDSGVQTIPPNWTIECYIRNSENDGGGVGFENGAGANRSMRFCSTDRKEICPKNFPEIVLEFAESVFRGCGGDAGIVSGGLLFRTAKATFSDSLQ
jgi:hypothetical protein